MKGMLLLLVAAVALAACGTNPVAPTSQKVVRPAFDETVADAPIADAPPEKGGVLPPCEKGSPAFFAIIEHAPPEVFARLCAEKPAP